MSWSVIVQSLPTFEKALWVTIWMSAVGIALAALVGLIVSLAEYFGFATGPNSLCRSGAEYAVVVAIILSLLCLSGIRLENVSYGLWDCGSNLFRRGLHG